MPTIIKDIQSLYDYLKNNRYDIRDIFECNSYNAIYFNLIGLYKSYNCYSEDNEVIDYILSSY